MRKTEAKNWFSRKSKKQNVKLGINLRLKICCLKIRLDENEINKLRFTIYTLVIFFHLSISIIIILQSSFFNFNKFSCCIGILSIVLYVNSQQIINKIDLSNLLF
jgi:hypothetical protein